MDKQGCTLFIRDDKMKPHERNPALRQGQFQWMDEPAKKSYLTKLKKKIDDGFYFSDKVIWRIVDEIAPVLNEAVGQEK